MMLQLHTLVRFTCNGILGVPVDDPKVLYDCSPQGTGHRFWEGATAEIVAVHVGCPTSFGRALDCYEVVTPFGSRGFVDETQVIGVCVNQSL